MNLQSSRVLLAGCCLALGALGVACGDDSSDGSAGGAGGSAGENAGGSGGSGGATGGSGGSGGSGGASGGTAGMGGGDTCPAGERGCGCDDGDSCDGALVCNDGVDGKACRNVCAPPAGRLDSQLKIDNFAGLDCDVVAGDLLIGDRTVAVMTLPDLTSLVEVQGDLELEALGNTDLSNLSSLQAVGVLSVGYATVTSLNGLEKLVSAEGLRFNNTNLTQIEALAGITSLTGSLVFGSNGDLASLEGLHNLTTVDTILMVNNGLTSLDGLRSLTTVNDPLFINDNASLKQCDVDTFDAQVSPASCSGMNSSCTGNSSDACN